MVLDFERMLKGSAQKHGHMCPGQVVGVRMAMLGLSLIGLDNPKETCDIKKIIVYVEMDRCATDAISYVTGVSLGRRSLKFMDYGIMAATFINLETNKAYRVVSKESAREKAAKYAPGIPDKHEQQLEAYKLMSLTELFEVNRVVVDIKASDMPGPSAYKTACQKCGIIVRDQKQMMVDGRPLCHECAGIAYYKIFESISLTE